MRGLFQNKYGQPVQLARFTEINIQNIILVTFFNQRDKFSLDFTLSRFLNIHLFVPDVVFQPIERNEPTGLSRLLSPVYVICKQGNDSQKAVQILENMSGSEVDRVTVKDICGGLAAWARGIDRTFPQY